MGTVRLLSLGLTVVALVAVDADAQVSAAAAMQAGSDPSAAANQSAGVAGDAAASAQNSVMRYLNMTYRVPRGWKAVNPAYLVPASVQSPQPGCKPACIHVVGIPAPSEGVEQFLRHNHPQSILKPFQTSRYAGVRAEWKGDSGMRGVTVAFIVVGRLAFVDLWVQDPGISVADYADAAEQLAQSLEVSASPPRPISPAPPAGQSGKRLSGSFATFMIREKAEFTADGWFRLSNVGTTITVPRAGQGRGSAIPMTGVLSSNEGTYEIRGDKMILRFSNGDVGQLDFEDLGTDPKEGRQFKLGGKRYSAFWGN